MYKVLKRLKYIPTALKNGNISQELLLKAAYINLNSNLLINRIINIKKSNSTSELTFRYLNCKFYQHLQFREL